MTRKLFSAVVAMLVVSLAEEVGAIVEVNAPMVYDVGERRIDRSPPTAPFLRLLDIGRGEGVIAIDSVVVSWSESETGSAVFVVSGSTDNRTPEEKLGYRIHVLNGDPPLLRNMDVARLAALGGRLLFYWNDGGDWDQEAILFRVTATAIDRAGNESLPSNSVIVGHDGSTEWMRQYMQAEAERMVRGAEPPRPEKHARGISEVFDDGVVQELDRVRSGRIDVVTLHYGTESTDAPRFDKDSSVVTTQRGRELAISEIRQLKSMLLEPRTYTAEQGPCHFTPRYALALQSDSPILVLIGETCVMIQINDGEMVNGARVTLQWSPILRGFCDGLMQLPALAEDR